MHAFTKMLLNLSEIEYKYFTDKLVPDTRLEILGVRTPLIKHLAKKLSKENLTDISLFFKQKHIYQEECLLHGFLLSYIKDIDQLILKFNEFLPQIDNWAVCDCTVAALKLFKKYPKKILEWVKEYIKSDNPYTVRVGIIILLDYFLDQNFSNDIINLVQSVKSEHYYINMGLAWFYSVALVKQY